MAPLFHQGRFFVFGYRNPGRAPHLRNSSRSFPFGPALAGCLSAAGRLKCDAPLPLKKKEPGFQVERTGMQTKKGREAKLLPQPRLVLHGMQFTKGELPADQFLRRLCQKRQLTAYELKGQLRAVDALAAGKLRPVVAPIWAWEQGPHQDCYARLTASAFSSRRRIHPS